jgi:hypothetical protein
MLGKLVLLRVLLLPVLLAITSIATTVLLAVVFSLIGLRVAQLQSLSLAATIITLVQVPVSPAQINTRVGLHVPQLEQQPFRVRLTISSMEQTAVCALMQINMLLLVLRRQFTPHALAQLS